MMNTEILTPHLSNAAIRVHPSRVFDRDSDWDWHIHGECEMYLSLAGEKIFTVDGREIIPGPDEVLYIAGHVPHKTLTKAGSEGILLQFADPTERRHGWLPMGGVTVQLLASNDPVGQQIARSMRLVQEEFIGRQSAYESFIVAQIGMIAAHLRRSGVLRDLDDEPKLGRMLPILEDMQQHCHEPLSLTELAARFGFAPSYLSALLRSTIGMTFTEILLRMRVRRAQEMLLQGQESLEYIAQACGFSCSSYFIQQFKRIHGCTPHRLRRGKR